jgi:3-oxoacyl-[acyl-carrier protein] reductase
MDLGIKGRVALVCGSSKGLGRAIAESLAREGAKVAICARTKATLAAAAADIHSRYGSPVLPLEADVSSETDSERLVKTVCEEWNTVHILVNNAGGPPAGPFEAHSPASWRNALELNFLSSVQLSRLVIPLMKQQRWGRIINVTSVAVKQPVDGLILSNAVRAGVAGLAKSLANELGPFNILVNTVCPGYTKTDRLLQIAEALAQRTDITPPEVLKGWERLIPLGRLGEPEELAALVTFLASERASYITGTTIQVDGGFVKGLL